MTTISQDIFNVRLGKMKNISGSTVVLLWYLLMEGIYMYKWGTMQKQEEEEELRKKRRRFMEERELDEEGGGGAPLHTETT